MNALGNVLLIVYEFLEPSHLHSSPLAGLKGAMMSRQTVLVQQCALVRAKFALSASRSQTSSMLVALRLTQQAAHRLLQQQQHYTIDIGACVIL